MSCAWAGHAARTQPLDDARRVSSEEHLPLPIRETLSKLPVRGDGNCGYCDSRSSISNTNGSDTSATSVSQSHAMHNLQLPEPEKFRESFDTSQSTECAYRADVATGFAVSFKHAREQLDYSFHCNYTLERQQLVQDPIIAALTSCGTSASQPWVVFTAGVMGSGKSHTLATLHKFGIFNLSCFVRIDPDEVRQLLPEFQVRLGSDDGWRLQWKKARRANDFFPDCFCTVLYPLLQLPKCHIQCAPVSRMMLH